MKCALLSHGNSVPEGGFSINKILLDAHGHSIKENTIVALVNNKLYSIGGATKFVMNRNLIESCKAAHAKSVTNEEKKVMGREEETKRKGRPKLQEKKKSSRTRKKNLKRLNT